MRKTFLRIGSCLAFLAVTLGAFGAHGLKEIIAPEQLNTFEIGVRYQLYHAFAILIVGLLSYFRKVKLLHWAGWFFFIGVILFSGSLYLLAFKEIFDLPLGLIGPITPIGGLMFIIGWALFFFSTFQKNERKEKGGR